MFFLLAQGFLLGFAECSSVGPKNGCGCFKHFPNEENLETIHRFPNSSNKKIVISVGFFWCQQTPTYLPLQHSGRKLRQASLEAKDFPMRSWQYSTLNLEDCF